MKAARPPPHPAIAYIQEAEGRLQLALATFRQEDPYPWFSTALGELGVKERPGPADNPRIVEYHSVTRPSPGHEDDETPWCSSFACWCMERTHIEHPRSKRARSWEKWGKKLAAPTRGCVVVLWRVSPSSRKGHVGFFDRFDGDSHFVMVGGNQSNKVSRKRYPRSRVLSYHLPA